MVELVGDDVAGAGEGVVRVEGVQFAWAVPGEGFGLGAVLVGDVGGERED